MTKPKFIRADYNTTVEFDLKELEIDWNKVLDHYIKWSELKVTFEDGVARTYDPTMTYESDWKWAKNEKILDAKHEVINDDEL